MKRNGIFIVIVLLSLFVTALILLPETSESEIIPEFKDYIIQSGLDGPLYHFDFLHISESIKSNIR